MKQTKTTTYWAEGDIIRNVASSSNINEVVAREMVRGLDSFVQKSGLKKQLLFVDMADISTISREARVILDQRREQLDKLALVVRNPVHRFIAHVFVRVSRKKNTKIFENADDAKKWLEAP